MRNIKILLTAILISVAFVGCNKGNNSKYSLKTATDANGYKYEYVTNDPTESRVYTLDNGLKVYLSKNEIEPRIFTLIGVRAGSKDEDPRSTGLAHYFEHLMFKGTDKIGTTDWEKESVLLDQIADNFELRRNSDDPAEQNRLYKKIDSLSLEAAKYAIPSEYDKCITSIGGSSTNAGTSYDLTVYINEIPSNQLEKWIRLEADRFENVKLRLFHTELETVYEEFNMYQDMDGSRFNQAMSEVLYKNHPYSRDVIGLPEHLKLPSMKDIYTFHDTYYIPNNMAVALAGDIDYETTIKLVDKYFGKLEKKELPERKKYVADPITEPQVVDVYGPESEMVKIAYRFDNTEQNEILLTALNSILYNGESGIIDLDLVQSQKVLNAYAYTSGLNDYIEFGLFGKPREGQTLEEVKDLLFAELDKVKNGNFDDDLLEASLNNYLKDEMESNEYNSARAYGYMMSFIEGKDYIDKVTYLDKFSKVTKDQVVNFAKTNCANNYVIGYKHLGTPQNIVKVEKPEISEIPINRDVQSEFATEIQNMPVKEIEPVFLDYDKEITHKNIKEGFDFYYIKNHINDIFKLYYIVDMGKYADLKLPIAIDYLTYLGTDEYTPEELKQELYKLALTFDVRAGNDMSYVYISGLNDKFEQAVELLEHIIHNAVADQDTYNKYVDGILKQRANNKINPNVILWSAMRDYGTYGIDNPTTYLLSEEELRNLNPQELVDLVKGLFNYEHLAFYYGNEPVDKVNKIIVNNHKVPEDLLPLPEEKEFKKLDVNQNAVYLVDYDMVQANMLMVSRGDKFDVEDLPYMQVFSEYYGGGLSSIVFQEIRESRSLAYSSMAAISTPNKKDDFNSMFCFVGTQADKLPLAATAITNLMNEMPKAGKQFNLSKESILKKIESNRITKDKIFFNWYSNKKLGIDYDVRKDVFDKVSTMELADFEKYFNERVANKQYNYMIIGKKSTFDINYLNKLGKVKTLSLDEIFNY